VIRFNHRTMKNSGFFFQAPLRQMVYLFALLALVAACKTAEQPAQEWYKGNLHTHSFWSDGDDFPEMIMEWYKTRGYDFVALSDHNILAQGEKWINMAADTMYRNAFNRYLQKYGEDWIDYKEDSGRLSIKLKTFEEYRPLFEEKEKFLIIQSQEITDRFENKHLHLNATNIEELIKPQGGSSVVEVLQNNIDAVRRRREETGQPSIIHINHPNFHYSISLEDMIALEGERFFEVFNGHPQVHNQGDSVHIGTEDMWDQVNLAYLQKGKPLIFGLATDDSHNYHRTGRQWSNAGRGWIMVQADSLSPEALIEAMEAGDFYASTGVTLSRLEHTRNKLEVEVDALPDTRYQISFIGCLKGENQVKILKEVTGDRADFKMNSDLLYIRVKVVSDRLHPNPVEQLDYEMAWTQPFQHATN
jgi:hypothetical protein